VEAATAPFNNWELRNYVIDVRKNYDQYIDRINPDEITAMGWVADSRAKAESLVQEFTRWIEAHKEEITALQLFYAQPFRRRELSYKMIKDLAEAIKADKPTMAPVEGTIPFREANTPSRPGSFRVRAAASALRSPLMARSTKTAGTTAA
jgi:type I restriction enzyme R subunit